MWPVPPLPVSAWTRPWPWCWRPWASPCPVCAAAGACWKRGGCGSTAVRPPQPTVCVRATASACPRPSRNFFLILPPVGTFPAPFPARDAGRPFSNPPAGTASVWQGAAAAALRPPSLRCGPGAAALRPGPCCNAWMPVPRASSAPPWRMMRTAWPLRCGISAGPKPGAGAARAIWPCCPAAWSGRPACAWPWTWHSAVGSVCWTPRPPTPPAGPGSVPCTAGRGRPAVPSPAGYACAFPCPSRPCPTA